LEVSRDFGQFLGRLRGKFVSEIEGFAGSLKVAGILGSFIPALLSGGDSKGPSKNSKNPSHFRKSSKNPQKIKCFSQKTLEKFNQNLPVSPKFLQKKNWLLLDD
jgi:hypothetical protein